MKLLLLVQNEKDVQHLNAAAQNIAASAITGVWVVFSPAITVNAVDAAAKLDEEIRQLRQAERAAADRSDYQAAAGYKTQREGKELDKAKTLADAWKTAPEAARKARVDTIFKPFTTTLQAKPGMNVRVTGHGDHYEREQWVAMLNSLSGAWFKPFEPGSFVVAWPESVKDALAVVAPAAVVEPAPAPATPTETPVAPAAPAPRRGRPPKAAAAPATTAALSEY